MATEQTKVFQERIMFVLCVPNPFFHLNQLCVRVGEDDFFFGNGRADVAGDVEVEAFGFE